MAARRPLTETQRARRRAQERTKRLLKQGRTGLEQFGDIVRAETFARGKSEGEYIPFTYIPTNTTWPENGWDHRRTTDAGYDRERQILKVKLYTNGAEYEYWPVPPAVARAFRRTESPGKFINAVLNNYNYQRVD